MDATGPSALVNCAPQIAEWFADASRTNYKPEASAAIDAARETPAVRKFLRFARYPSASVVSLPENRGFQVEIRDLRFVRPPGAEQRR